MDATWFLRSTLKCGVVTSTSIILSSDVEIISIDLLFNDLSTK